MMSKTLIKEIKGKVNKKKDIPWSWVGKLNIVMMLVLPNLIYRFNIMLIKISASYFMDIHKLILKFMWKGKRSHPVNNIEGEEKSWRTHLTQLQHLLWSYYNQNNMVPVREQTSKSMNQNREPRNAGWGKSKLTVVSMQTKSLFLYYSLLIIGLFSIVATVNLLLPDPM